MEKKYLKLICALSIGICAFADSDLQAFSLFSKSAPKSVRKGPKKPTEITSQTLDADLAKDTIIFTGNVLVDDEQMIINCHKMTIFLEEKEPEPAKEGEKKEKKLSDKDQKTDKEEKEKTAGGKEPVRVLCEGDVVIIRKIYDDEEKAKGKQRSKSDRAVYDLKKGIITFTGNRPRISRGEDEIEADKITIWTDSDKFKAEGNTKLMIASAFEDDDEKVKKEKEQKLLDEQKKQKTQESKPGTTKTKALKKIDMESNKSTQEKNDKPQKKTDEFEGVEDILNENPKANAKSDKEESVEDLIKDEVIDNAKTGKKADTEKKKEKAKP